MKQQLVLALEDSYPFGQAPQDNQEDHIIVVKKINYGNVNQRTTLLKKAEFLKLMSGDQNIVGLLGYQEGHGYIELIYEYIPFVFSTLLQKNSDYEIAQARGTLARLATWLQELGIRTNIRSDTVGLDASDQLKYYLSIDDVPEDPPFDLLQYEEEEEHYSEQQSAHEEGEDSYVEHIYPPRDKYTPTKIQSPIQEMEHLLAEECYAAPRMSGLSQQSQSLQRTEASCYRMDDLLQKINSRVHELSSRRRKTTSSRPDSKELSLHQNENFGEASTATPQRNDSTNSSQVQIPKVSRFEKVKGKMTQSIKPKTFESMIEVKLKYSSATGSLVDEYESLKVERREMLDRIKVMIERTDFMLSHHKTRKASSSQEILNL